ncbi:hypothetical protein MJO29_000157 [Puccinia striiformis f. sp. tritici]|nr:hypothetical protein MJO29_000157 [Puccinia striiformis f. sp. tritici]
MVEFLSEYVDGFPRTEKDLDKTVPEGSESVADIYSKMANSEDSRTDKEIIQDQNETISKLIQEMKEFKDSYQEMSRMFKEHSVAPQNVPIPATPNPRVIPSLRFATSTPRGERTYAMDTTIGAGDQIKKLTAALDYQQRGAPPHLSRPSSPGLSEARARYTPLECFYCGGKHGVNTCDFFGPDLQERRVLRYQGMYHYPNRQPIVVENGMSVREMVQRYHDEQEKLSRAKDPAPEPTAGIAALDEWGSWVPPQANIDEDDLQTNIGFGLRKSQRIQEKNPPSGSQTIPNKPQEPVSKTPPPNQEALKSTTRRKSFPGSWMEEDTVEEEESSGRCTKDSVPPLEKGKQASQTPTGTKEDAGGRLDKSIRNKFYKQTYTLTLEEIVKIAPQFLKGLQESLLNEEGPGKGANNWDLLDQLAKNNRDKNKKIIPDLNWESFEQLENFEEPSILQDGKESPITGQSEKIARDDPWKVYISEPVDWVNELGGFKFTLEEQTKIDAEEEELAKMWGSAVDDKDTGVGYYWLELHIPSRFKDVFDETNRPKRERKAQIWLRELPGGFSNSLDFLQILSFIGERAFLQEGSWVSRYGIVSRKVRQRLYSGGGRKWYQAHVTKTDAKANKWSKHCPTYFQRIHIC